MFLIQDVLVTEDVLEAPFACDIQVCKGACCVEGTSGAPITEVEQKWLAENLPSVLPFLEMEKIKEIESEGFFELDQDGDAVTKCLKNGECVFSKRDDQGILVCGIQKAHMALKITQPKPISCYLYPIRESKVGDYTAIQYHRWSICNPACEKGRNYNVPLYIFLKEPLILRFGENWYQELNEVAQQWKFQKSRDNLNH